MINIIISYPLIIFVTNSVIESILFSAMKYSKWRYWLKNLSRTIVLTVAVVFATIFYSSLHKILGLIGVILGSILVLVMPALIHNRIIARTSSSRCFNYFIIAFAALFFFITTFLIIYCWDSSEKK